MGGWELTRPRDTGVSRVELTEGDMKRLCRAGSKRNRVVCLLVLGALTIVMLSVATRYFVMASRHAERAGTTLGGIVFGTDAPVTRYASYIKALRAKGYGLVLSVGAFCIALLGIGYWQVSRMAEKVVATLRGVSGETQPPDGAR